MSETKEKESAPERDKLLADFRKLTPGERLALRMAAKAEAKAAKREQRTRLGADQ
jgi:hypothetical protein